MKRQSWTDLDPTVRAARARLCLMERPHTGSFTPLGRSGDDVATRDLIVWFTHAGAAPLPEVALAVGLPLKHVHRIIGRLLAFEEHGPGMAAVLLRTDDVPAGTRAGWYAMIRPGAWPWRRRGQRGNRGGGRRDPSCPSTTTPHR